ncbi:hypothetical protein PLESTB_000924900 [Pleodorina starrii]|uniref:Uncharacterized protein n=1 Tax=Pleodorina starrii TaxID=330485 RepID=A0A9W6F395_9CHLO|nr:hypothetical protein PLESTM_001560300 [Pleodorina starrii]GLC54958.1 hypothetical protein PLESTB_000924900 [Pleodorina starrii]GLC68479.1 hypothetical protein PLESTF_000695900 [Pleodorina starrii]
MKTNEAKQEVEELKRLITGFEERRATLVGGQLACILDDIVCRTVLGPGCVMSLGKLKKYIEDGANVTDEQRRKWDAVVRFLQRRSGASMQQLIAALLPLRDQRYPAAHGTHEEHDISTAELSRSRTLQSAQP